MVYLRWAYNRLFMATTYRVRLRNTRFSNFAVCIREFGGFEPHRQLMSVVGYDTVKHVKYRC